MRAFLALTTLLLAALAAGCAGDRPPLRIGLNPWPGYDFLWLAEQEGLFRGRGVDVQLLEFESLTDARRAFERGRIDGFASTIVETLYAREQSTRRPRVVLVADYSNGADVLLAGPAIESPGALRGRRVGVEPATVNLLLLHRALAHSGLALSDVTLVRVDLSTMLDRFRAGEVDAVVTYPPESTKLLATGAAHVVFSSRSMPRELIDVVSFDEGILLDRAGEVQAVIDGYFDAVAWAGAHADAAAARIAAREGLTVAEYRQLTSEAIWFVSRDEQDAFLRPGGHVERAIQNASRALYEGGALRTVAVAGDCVWHPFVGVARR